MEEQSVGALTGDGDGDVEVWPALVKAVELSCSSEAALLGGKSDVGGFALLRDVRGGKLGAGREMVATNVEAAMAAARRSPDGELIRTTAGRALARLYACGWHKMTLSAAPHGQWKKKAANTAADQRAPRKRIFRF